jgi:hypothetical protein
MRRDINGQLVFERLNVYEPISHLISDQNNIQTLWECIYEHVKLYTDAGNPIVAFNFCKYGRLICYDKTKETTATKTILKDDHTHIQTQKAIINQQFNAYQNCFGFCVLNGQFWLNIVPETLNQIITEDNYIETQNLETEHLSVYYKDSLPIHISKYNTLLNRYDHKIGCNSHHFTPTVDISNIYNYDNIKHYSKAN